MPSEVADPPTSSTPTGVPDCSPVVVRLPARNVWMSPVSDDRFFTPVGDEAREDLLALGAVAVPLVLVDVLARGRSSAISITSLPTASTAPSTPAPPS